MSALKVGDICIWQNQVGDMAYLNGTECTILGPLVINRGVNQFGKESVYVGHLVDTKVPWFPSGAYAELKDLRLKNPPATPEAIEEYNELINRINEGVTA